MLLSRTSCPGKIQLTVFSIHSTLTYNIKIQLFTPVPRSSPHCFLYIHFHCREFLVLIQRPWLQISPRSKISFVPRFKFFNSLLGSLPQGKLSRAFANFTEPSHSQSRTKLAFCSIGFRLAVTTCVAIWLQFNQDAFSWKAGTNEPFQYQHTNSSHRSFVFLIVTSWERL